MVYDKLAENISTIFDNFDKIPKQELEPDQQLITLNYKTLDTETNGDKAFQRIFLDGNEKEVKVTLFLNSNLSTHRLRDENLDMLDVFYSPDEIKEIENRVESILLLLNNNNNNNNNKVKVIT